jgi:Rps23 Pro-64 3,4-dihydroxylase Tpa1-like proline 4-hydroxylase
MNSPAMAADAVSERPATTTPTPTAHGYSVDPDELMARGRRLNAEYVKNQPFPHIVIDDFFPEAALQPILDEFPRPRGLDWQRFDNGNEKKLALRAERQLGPRTRQFLWELNSQVFIEFLEELTGIKGLIPDPHLVGGGLHQIERGGKLKMHADFNHHARLKLDRRLNLLLYLNRDWSEEYGGHLELWDREMKGCVKKVLPIFDRLVVFSTTDTSYHGHPNPLTCPEGRTRKSIAMYYYTNGRPAEETSEGHSTLFVARPGEQVAPSEERSAREKLKDFVPPILLQGLRKLQGKPARTPGPPA